MERQLRIALLTCTGGRPDAFALCEKWVARQTRQPDQWIVVDDVLPETELTMEQEVIRPRPEWRTGDCTMNRNLLAGLDIVDADVVVFWEDDDYYLPNWLKYVETEAAAGYPIIGEKFALYYNVATRRYHKHGNDQHASLCATAVSSEIIDDVVRIIQDSDALVDIPLWDALGSDGVLLNTQQVIGIKGMPGRAGIGRGHSESEYWMNDDICGDYLREITGDDAEYYLGFCDREVTEFDVEYARLCRKMLPTGENCATPLDTIMQTRDAIREMVRQKVGL